MPHVPTSGSALQAIGTAGEATAGETRPEQPRMGYETPLVTPLGAWTALTLAGSLPISLSLPLFSQ